MAAFNLHVLVHGPGEREEQFEPFVASFDSMGWGDAQNDISADAIFLKYVWFLLNACHGISKWVHEQDEADIGSLQCPNWTEIIDGALTNSKQLNGFFNSKNVQRKYPPSAGWQPDSNACGLYTALNSGMLIEVERD